LRGCWQVVKALPEPARSRVLHSGRRVPVS
jgi:hypothetical protein